MTEAAGMISVFHCPDDDETGSVIKQFMPTTDAKWEY
jgi:hypothetical protein